MPRLPDRRRLARLAEKRAASRQERARECEAAELPRRRVAAFLRWHLRTTASRGTVLARCFPSEDDCPALDRALEMAAAAARLLQLLGDTPQARDADDALLTGIGWGPPLGDLAAAVKRYYEGKPLDREHASLIDLVAWCAFKGGKVPLGERIAWPDGTQTTVVAVP
jgi:hypothetical protein